MQIAWVCAFLLGLSLSAGQKVNSVGKGRQPGVGAVANSEASKAPTEVSKSPNTKQPISKQLCNHDNSQCIGPGSPAKGKDEEYFRNWYQVPLRKRYHSHIPPGYHSALPGKNAKLPTLPAPNHPSQPGNKIIQSNGKDSPSRPSTPKLPHIVKNGGSTSPLGPPPGLLPSWLNNPGTTTPPPPVVQIPDPVPRENPGMPEPDQIVRDFNGRFQPHSVFDRDVRRNLLFWTGVTDDEARAVARRNGWQTLSMLIAGPSGTFGDGPYRQWLLGNWNGRYRWFDQRVPMWQRLAIAMATFAEGEVRVMISNDEAATRPDSVWNAFESPTLRARGVRIIWLDEHGNPRQPLYPAPPSPGRTPPGSPGLEPWMFPNAPTGPLGPILNPNIFPDVPTGPFAPAPPGPATNPGHRPNGSDSPGFRHGPSLYKRGLYGRGKQMRCLLLAARAAHLKKKAQFLEQRSSPRLQRRHVIH